MSSRPHSRKLAELGDREVKAKQAQREAELAAMAARNGAEQAEQQVVRAYGGHGELRKAQRALTKAEADARETGLRAKGAAFRLEEIQTEIARYRATHFRELIAESEPEAARSVEMLRQGLELIVEGDALWRGHAQLVSDYLIAAGHQPRDNLTAEHALSEIGRQLRRVDGEIAPPLPHNAGIELRQQEERTATRMRQQRAAT